MRHKIAPQTQHDEADAPDTLCSERQAVLRHCSVSPVFYWQCWETYIGQEMYKLTVFDFFIVTAVTFFVEFPRK